MGDLLRDEDDVEDDGDLWRPLWPSRPLWRREPEERLLVLPPLLDRLRERDGGGLLWSKITLMPSLWRAWAMSECDSFTLAILCFLPQAAGL